MARCSVPLNLIASIRSALFAAFEAYGSALVGNALINQSADRFQTPSIAPQGTPRNG